MINTKESENAFWQKSSTAPCTNNFSFHSVLKYQMVPLCLGRPNWDSRCGDPLPTIDSDGGYNSELSTSTAQKYHTSTCAWYLSNSKQDTIKIRYRPKILWMAKQGLRPIYHLYMLWTIIIPVFHFDSGLNWISEALNTWFEKKNPMIMELLLRLCYTIN